MKRSLILLLFLPLFPALPAFAADSLRLSLDDSVRAALDYSQSLKAAGFEVEAAAAREKSASAALLPRIDVDGRYSYSAQVLPAIHLPPPGFGGLTTIDFGFHNAYSIGLAANWDIIGGIATWRQAQAAAEQRRAQEAMLADQRQTLRLRVRLAYFQTQLAETQVRLYSEALKLAQSQAHDLDLRLKAGSSSKIDWYTASNDELDRRASYRLAQVSLAGALRDLFALTGQHQDADVSIPTDDAVAQALPASVEQPTLSVNLDDTASLLDGLASAESAPFKPQDLAKLRVLQDQVAFYQRQAELAFAGHLPSGTLGFRWSEDYPEAPVNQAVDQQTTSANFNLPLFSFGHVQQNVVQQDKLAQAAQESLGDATVQTQTDWAKSHDRLSGLRAQRDLQAQEARQTADLQDMVYKSYKIGGSTFLEVQSTSLQSLQAGLSLAQTETQMLIELANLSALTEGDR
jgi:outer membrane protein TolC